MVPIPPLHSSGPPVFPRVLHRSFLRNTSVRRDPALSHCRGNVRGESGRVWASHWLCRPTLRRFRPRQPPPAEPGVIGSAGWTLLDRCAPLPWRAVCCAVRHVGPASCYPGPLRRTAAHAASLPRCLAASRLPPFIYSQSSSCPPRRLASSSSSSLLLPPSTSLPISILRHNQTHLW